MNEPIARCGICAIDYALREWRMLAFVGVHVVEDCGAEGPGGLAEMRNCACGASLSRMIAVDLDPLASSARQAFIERDQLREALVSVQARCTELATRVRELERAMKMRDIEHGLRVKASSPF